MDINVEFGQMFDGDVVEWFEAEGHVFDLCGINQSDRIALEKLKELYDASSPAKKQQMRGMLRLLEDGLTNGYMHESTEALARIWDLSQSAR